jgi:hypothetical protein
MREPLKYIIEKEKEFFLFSPWYEAWIMIDSVHQADLGFGLFQGCAV